MKIYRKMMCPLYFAYVISGDTTYAALVRTYLLAYNTWPTWGRATSFEERDLSLTFMMTGYAVAYDWVYDRFPESKQYPFNDTNSMIQVKVGHDQSDAATILKGNSGTITTLFLCNGDTISDSNGSRFLIQSPRRITVEAVYADPALKLFGETLQERSSIGESGKYNSRN